MKSQETFGGNVRFYVEQSPVGVAGIARAAGLPRSLLYKIMGDEATHGPRLDTVVAIAAALGVHPAQLIPPALSADAIRAARAVEAGGWAAVHELGLIVRDVLASVEEQTQKTP